MKETVKQGAVLKEEAPEVAVNGEDTVPVDAGDEFKGHRSRALHGVQIAAGGAEEVALSYPDCKYSSKYFKVLNFIILSLLGLLRCFMALLYWFTYLESS